jgi:hypothetical protein
VWHVAWVGAESPCRLWVGCAEFWRPVHTPDGEAETVPELVARRNTQAGPERLLYALAKRGMKPEHMKSAAAFVLALDDGLRQGWDR